MSSPFPSNLVAASRSGRVAWVFDAKGVRNLWVADAPNFAARQVTHYDGDEGLPIASLRITADGRTLVYVRGSETNESGRVADPTNGVWSRKQQVWAVDVDAGAPRMLGEMGCAEEECEDVELSPDGQFAVWAARKQLWIAPVTGATPAHQLTDLRGDNSNPKWSPDGRQIALVSNRGDHSFIAIYDFGHESRALSCSQRRSRCHAALVAGWAPHCLRPASRHSGEAAADSGAPDSLGDLGGGFRDRRSQARSGTAERKRTIRFPKKRRTSLSTLPITTDWCLPPNRMAGITCTPSPRQAARRHCSLQVRLKWKMSLSARIAAPSYFLRIRRMLIAVTSGVSALKEEGRSR